LVKVECERREMREDGKRREGEEQRRREMEETAVKVMSCVGERVSGNCSS
jgi:hypothetical protein